MNEEWQSDAELEAHQGPSGPVAVAWRWLEALCRLDDFDAAWALMTPTLRLARAQAWLWNNRAEFGDQQSLEQHAARLAELSHAGDLWPMFAEVELDLFQSAFAIDDWDEVGAASRPRPISPGVELVIFVDQRQMRQLPGAVQTEEGVVGVDKPGGLAVIPVAVLLLEHADGRWLVAGHNHERFPEPGWPPTL